MKKIIYLILLIGSVRASAQTISGKLVSAGTNKPISGATVKLLLSNKATATNFEGAFNLQKNSNITIDTLAINSLGFLPVKIATNKLPQNGIFSLKEDLKNLKEVGINKNRKKFKMLNPFDYGSADYTLAKDTSQAFISSKFPIAKLFTANVDSFKLESIHVGRFVERLVNDSYFILNRTTKGDAIVPGYANIPQIFFYQMKRHTQRAIFNLYIIYPDSNGTPEPLNKALKIPVSVDKALSDTEIKLDQYDIHPKQRNFMIAIEWLPILPNQNYSLGKRGHPRIMREFTLPTPKGMKNDGSPEMGLVYELGYEPYVTVYNTQSTNASKKFGWINNEWVNIDNGTEGKFEQEIALSASISYY